MSAFAPQSFEEAKLTHKPLGKGRMTRSPKLDGKPPLRPAIARNGASGLKRRPSSAVPYATNSMGARKKADPQLAAWGRAVKKRDGNKCQWKVLGPCATGDTRIDPHHIAPRGRRPDLRYVVANGIALCRTHHDWVGDHPIEAEAIGLLSSETYEKARKQS